VRILAIETSGLLGSVALLQADKNNAAAVETLFESRTSEGQRTAQSLAPTIQDALKHVGWRPTDVELVGVTSGPGSFTGLRIGVVAAKTFSYATGAALVGVNTLAALAAGVPSLTGRLWTILDAQRQELFVSQFEASTVDELDQSVAIRGISDFLAQLSPGDTIVGPPLEKLKHQLPAGVLAADESCWHPKASATGGFALGLFEQGNTTSPLELVPQYYRRSAAEEKAVKQRSE
jgi:tRNA threonylcarbamoyladenosine biosynthesis protein TsaB